ncbi:MAG TPA: ABC transporter permease, partial [Blastocatellia bacterium]|nr:ABC transporter permease [Blastocatellia bacterium]
MIRDLRYGLRVLLKKPGFTAIALLTLAFGTGANTVIFSGVYAFFLQSLPYKNSDRLVAISQAGRQEFDTGVSYPDFQYWKERNTVFEQMAASRYVAMNLTDSHPVERVTGSLVSEDMFPLL